MGSSNTKIPPPTPQERDNIRSDTELHLLEIHANSVGITVGSIIALGLAALFGNYLYQRWKRNVRRQHLKALVQQARSLEPPTVVEIPNGNDSKICPTAPPGRPASLPTHFY